MAIYPMVQSGNYIVTIPSSSGTPSLAFDGSFATSCTYDNLGNNSSNASLAGKGTAASDVEPVRAANLVWRLSTSGVSATRSGSITYTYTGGPPSTVATDDTGQPASWFGVNKIISGKITVPIPSGTLSGNFVLGVAIVCTDCRIIFDMIEFYIDAGGIPNARIMTMLIPVSA